MTHQLSLSAPKFYSASRTHKPQRSLAFCALGRRVQAWKGLVGTAGCAGLSENRDLSSQLPAQGCSPPSFLLSNHLAIATMMLFAIPNLDK